MRTLLIFSILLLISIIAIEGSRYGSYQRRRSRPNSYRSGTLGLPSGTRSRGPAPSRSRRKSRTFENIRSPQRSEVRRSPKKSQISVPKEKRHRGDSTRLDIDFDIFAESQFGPGFSSRTEGVLEDDDIDPYYGIDLGSGADMEPIRRNTRPSKNMVAAPTNMRKVVEDLLRKYEGSKPLLVGVPYPVVYEIPARRNYHPPPPTYPAIYERNLDHHRPYSPQPQRPHRDYPEPTIPNRPPTYSNQQPLPPRHLEPRISDHRPTYSNQGPLPPAPITYPDPEYDPFILDGYSEEEVEGRYPPVNDGRPGPGNFDDNPRNSFQIRDPNHSPKPNNRREADRLESLNERLSVKRAPFRPPKEKKRRRDSSLDIDFDIYSKKRNEEEIDFNFDVFNENTNNQKFDPDVYQDDPQALVRPPPPGARGNPEYRSQPGKPRVNTKTIGPIGHPGKPTKGFGGNAGVRTLDISEYEDSREYPKYGPAEREYGPEYPSPNRSRQYTDSREYGPKEYRPEYPPLDRV